MDKLLNVVKLVEWCAIFLIALTICSGGCHWINKKMDLEDDHMLEEHIEEIIEHQTGLEIDLTPNDN